MPTKRCLSGASVCPINTDHSLCAGSSSPITHSACAQDASPWHCTLAPDERAIFKHACTRLLLSRHYATMRPRLKKVLNSTFCHVLLHLAPHAIIWPGHGKDSSKLRHHMHPDTPHTAQCVVYAAKDALQHKMPHRACAFRKWQGSFSIMHIPHLLRVQVLYRDRICLCPAFKDNKRVYNHCG